MDGPAGQKYQVPAGGNLLLMGSNHGTDSALCSIALYGTPHGSTGRHGGPGSFQVVPAGNQYHKRVRIGLTRTPHPLEVGLPRQAKSSVYLLFQFSFFT